MTTPGRAGELSGEPAAPPGWERIWNAVETTCRYCEHLEHVVMTPRGKPILPPPRKCWKSGLTFCNARQEPVALAAGEIDRVHICAYARPAAVKHRERRAS